MWIVENDPECLCLTFSVEEEVFGMVQYDVLHSVCNQISLMLHIKQPSVVNDFLRKSEKTLHDAFSHCF